MELGDEDDKADKAPNQSSDREEQPPLKELAVDLQNKTRLSNVEEQLFEGTLTVVPQGEKTDQVSGETVEKQITVTETSEMLPCKSDIATKTQVSIPNGTFNHPIIGQNVKNKHKAEHHYYGPEYHYYGPVHQYFGSHPRSEHNCSPSELMSTTQSTRAIEQHSNSFNMEVLKHIGNKEFTWLSESIAMCRDPIHHDTKVYRGIQKHVDGKLRDIAIKLVANNSRSQREVDILLKLEHPHLVQIYESGKTTQGANQIYIVMELCSQNLAQYIKERENSNFSVNAIYSKQLASGLVYMHEMGIVHGDITLENILFSGCKSRIKISDFGLSKEITQSYPKFPFNSFDLRSEGFKAAEMYADEAEASFKSDIFSFGIVTFYLFSNGKHPFGKDQHKWKCNIREGINLDLSSISRPQSNFPSHKQSQLEKLLESVLQHDPEARPTDKELQEAKFFTGIPLSLDDETGKELILRDPNKMDYQRPIDNAYAQSPRIGAATSSRVNVIYNVAVVNVATGGGRIAMSDLNCSNTLQVSNSSCDDSSSGQHSQHEERREDTRTGKRSSLWHRMASKVFK